MRTALLLFAAVLSVTADDNFWTSVPGLKAQNLEADAAGNLWAVDSETGIMWFLGANQNNWTLVDEIGVFTQVSVNDVGVVWAIGGTEQEPTTPHVLRRVGITPQRLTGTGWETVPGAMVQLSVGPRGNVVAVDVQNVIYFRKGVTSRNPSGSSWQVLDGRLTQVSYSNNGQIWGTNADANAASCQVWAIGTDQHIWKGNSNWHLVHNGPMNTIAADGEGNAIAVFTSGKIVYRNFWGGWADWPGILVAVDVNGEGIAAGVASDGRTWRYTSGTWVVDYDSAMQSMKQLSVGPQGNMIAVSQAGQVWVRIMVPVASSWVLFDTSKMLQHVSWSANWQIWGVDMSGNVVMRVGASQVRPKGTRWQSVPSPGVALTQIAIGKDFAAGITASGDIWIRNGISAQNPTGTTWTMMSGSLKSITVNSFGQIWGTSIDGKAWYSL
eukprot:m51a1_g1743 putative tectonin beta-propeller repeat-containing protein 1 (439) ;mRNA; r:188654-190343